MPFGVGEKKQAPVIREELLKSYPVRNPTIKTDTNEKGQVTIIIPLKSAPRWMRFFISPPEKKTLILDDLGSYVWQRCDGSHTFEDIINEMAQDFKFTKIEASASLLEFMKKLVKRGLIAFATKDQAKPNTEEKT
ncbi:MAG: PqqD family protein [Thermoprotei archaeon]